MEVNMSENENNKEESLLIVEGMEPIIQRDLDSHKVMLERTQADSDVFKQAVSHEVKKKRYYLSLIGGGKFNDDALRTSIDHMNINIRHLSDKAKAAQEKVKHHTLIIDTLTEQLKNYRENLQKLAEYKLKQAVKDAIDDRLGKSVN